MTNVDLWNSRSHLGPAAGTGDLIAAELERRYIAKYVKDGMRVLDVGCGNGITLLGLARDHQIIGWGFDSSPEMVATATRDARLQMNVGYLVGDVLTWDMPRVGGIDLKVDLIYSQRCLINLPDWPTQARAIERIISWLRPGGVYLAVECSSEGLAQTNALRAAVDLPPIVPPSHNVYLDDLKMKRLREKLWKERIAIGYRPEPICPTYALLSKVLNARLAADAGVEPRYDAEVNKLALRLPNVGAIGQNRCWQFRRCP